MSILKDIRPANRYRLSVLLVGFLVIQTFLPLLSQQPEWQWLANALLWMTLGAIVVGISAVAWLRPDLTVSVASALPGDGHGLGLADGPGAVLVWSAVVEHSGLSRE